MAAMWASFVVFSIATNPTPTNQAYAHLSRAAQLEASGRIASAWREVSAAKALLKTDDAFRRDVEARSAELARRVSHVMLDVKLVGPDVIIEQDGEVVPTTLWGHSTPIDGGDHVWTARIADFVFWRHEARVLEGGTVGVYPALPHLPPSDEPPPEAH